MKKSIQLKESSLLLPIAHCLLPIAHCPLPIAYCLPTQTILEIKPRG
ncbi:hypothetical protein [Nostoc sp. WHI]|nr:hypothetical protein [Nostoc sp. WHI]